MSYFPSRAAGGSLAPHAATHLDGGADEVELGLLAGTVTDAQVPASAVTQHSAALTIAASQITAGTLSGSYTISTNLTVDGALEVKGGAQSWIGATTNAFLGDGAGAAITSGTFNVAIGDGALDESTAATTNVCIGTSTIGQATNSSSVKENVVIGHGAGASVGSQALGAGGSEGNVIIGYQAGIRVGLTDDNTMVGYQTNRGPAAVGDTGARNIFIGHKAGFDETGDDTLIIDNADRGSEALGRTDALIYGVMNATPASQTLALNAATSIRYNLTVTGATIEETVTTLADDGTPTVAAGNLFKTGGTTAITDFDDGVVGQTIKILAAHSVTITDGAPIILAGGANFAMVATDTLELTMFDDQVWQEVSRSVN